MRILSIFGTRPEAIKMAPVIKALEANDQVLSTVCVTGQHRSMLDQVLEIFDICPTYDLDIMRKDQDLVQLTSRILIKISGIIQKVLPDRVLVHGDTTTAFASTLASFYAQIPVGHVEAGLRTGNINIPYPEELNRKLTDCMADLLFAPTKVAEHNLLKEGIPAQKIFVTGNTVVDSLLYVSDKLEKDTKLINQVQEKFPFPYNGNKLVLVTGHRRESFGEGFNQICKALTTLSKRSDVDIVYPVHLNPNVKAPVNRLLGDLKNVYLLQPLDYLSFVYAMKKSYIIISDSGGIQEEAPSLGKPVLLIRNSTERPEAVKTGTVKLVGTKAENIVIEASKLLDDSLLYSKRVKTKNPFGDGAAAQRIVKEILSYE